MVPCLSQVYQEMTVKRVLCVFVLTSLTVLVCVTQTNLIRPLNQK